ncbi:hypothetical protein RRG08_024520 [Elysia crispata]|uniref:Uncharacterized protein n=1 Tax=Elysia crispata TaxID=231223 RepID=A0AAE1CU26_9GAST|nr:hypothetical protein RRG08_024520 [Elysia crispata]
MSASKQNESGPSGGTRPSSSIGLEEISWPKSGNPEYDNYMTQTLGKFLPECLKALTLSRPPDPIQFLSNCLHDAVESEQYLQEKEKNLKDLNHFRKGKE